jgi:hypothetical protein
MRARPAQMARSHCHSRSGLSATASIHRDHPLQARLLREVLLAYLREELAWSRLQTEAEPI